MSFQPLPNFNYADGPPNGSWTLLYSKSAYGGQRDQEITNLYTQATALVQAHNLKREYFMANGKQQIARLRAARKMHVPTLVQHFKAALDVIEHQAAPGLEGFLERLCFGAIQYQGSSNQALKPNPIPAVPPALQPTLLSSTPTIAPFPPTPSIPSAPPPATLPSQTPHSTLSTSPTGAQSPSLSRFTFICRPMHLGVGSQPFALAARRLYPIEGGREHTIEDFSFEPLKAALIAKGLLVEGDGKIITYLHEDASDIGIAADDELWTAVETMHDAGKRSISLIIKSYKDMADYQPTSLHDLENDNNLGLFGDDIGLLPNGPLLPGKGSLASHPKSSTRADSKECKNRDKKHKRKGSKDSYESGLIEISQSTLPRLSPRKVCKTAPIDQAPPPISPPLPPQESSRFLATRKAREAKEAKKKQIAQGKTQTEEHEILTLSTDQARKNTEEKARHEAEKKAKQDAKEQENAQTVELLQATMSVDSKKGTEETGQPVEADEPDVMEGVVATGSAELFTVEKGDELIEVKIGDSSSEDVTMMLKNIANTQVVEHQSDGTWEEIAEAVGIDPKTSDVKGTWLLPGADDQVGALIGDMPGLGKTNEGLAIAVFRHHLWRQWQEIYADWDKASKSPVHCPQDAPKESICPSATKRQRILPWLRTCPCVPESTFHDIRPIHGPSFFIVPGQVLTQWRTRIMQWVDLRALGIQLVVCHKSCDGHEDGWPRFKRDIIRTVIPPNTPEPGKKEYTSEPAQRGYPTAASTMIWVLTTWNTWNLRFPQEYGVRRTWITSKTKTVQGKKEVMKKDHTDVVLRVHAGLWIVDESHNVKGKDRGPYGPIGQMIRDRPNHRPWFVCLSGTILGSDPEDILGPVCVMSRANWDNTKHPRHAVRPDALRATKRIIVKSRNDKSVASAAAAKSAVHKFGFVLPCLLIRRHPDSLWFGKRLLDLLPLDSRVARTKFPLKFQKAFQEELAGWKAEQDRILTQRVANYKQKCAADPNFKKKNPHPPTLNIKEAFSQARLSRVISDLPGLVKIAKFIQDTGTMRWTNDEVEKACEDPSTLRLKKGCPLDRFYKELVQDAPKLKAIKEILRPQGEDTRIKPTLIMSSFPEMLLVLERYLRQDKELGIKTAMYSGSDEQKTKAIETFIGLTSPETGKPVHDEQPDVLLGLAKKMGEGLDLPQAEVVILCEPLYDPNLHAQMPARARRQGTPHVVQFWVIKSDTEIEGIVDERRDSKENFTAAAFMTEKELEKYTVEEQTEDLAALVPQGAGKGTEEEPIEV